jgi:hypothetical protein
MPFFFCRLNPPRPSFAMDMTAEERALMGEHGAYWKGFAESGEGVIFGPVGDARGPWGLGILDVATRERAEALTAADPVIVADIGMSYEVHPMMSAILRTSDSSITS